jgi:hypothetical protein
MRTAATAATIAPCSQPNHPHLARRPSLKQTLLHQRFCYSSELVTLRIKCWSAMRYRHVHSRWRRLSAAASPATARPTVEHVHRDLYAWFTLLTDIEQGV